MATPSLLRAATMTADFHARRGGIAAEVDQLERDQSDVRVDPQVAASLVMAVFDGLII